MLLTSIHLRSPMSVPQRRRRGGSNGKLSSHHRQGATESVEDYLEAIEKHIADQGYARVSDVAETLDVNRASVSSMIKRLAEQGFVHYQRYRGFTLTEEGAGIAAAIRERHSVLEEFFSQMNVPEPAASRDVEGIEHHLSPETLSVFQILVDYWKAHPQEHEAFRRFAESHGSVNSGG